MLNFKGWEKTAEDKTTTTLKHDSGHTMVLAHKKLPKIQQEMLKRLKFAEGTPEGTVGDSQNNEDNIKPPQSTNITVNAASPQPMQPSQQSVVPVPVAVPSVPNIPNPQLPNGSMNAPAAAQSALGAAQLGSKIEAAQAAAGVPQQQQYLNQQAQLNQGDVNNINELKKRADDLAAHQGINPNAYIENMSAGRKMMSALGLIMGGAGSGLSGQPNIAYDYLNKQIDRNIQAQKDRFGQSATVWGAYKDLYGNEKIANDMARVHALDMVNNQAKMTALQLGTPQAAKNLLDLQSKIVPERNKLILDSAGSIGKGTLPENNPSGPVPRGTPPEAIPPESPGSVNEKTAISNTEAGANIPKKSLIEPDEYADTGILSPNAQEKLDALRYRPKAKDEIDQIKSQYTAAQQADTVLKQLHGVHQQLYKDAKEGGAGGYFRRHDPTSHIPIAGPLVSGATIQPATDNQVNRDYETNRTRVVSDIANALKGSNVSGEEINRIVEANSPEHGDTPEMVAKKERAIRIFIKNNVNKSLLKDWGLSK